VYLLLQSISGIVGVGAFTAAWLVLSPAAFVLGLAALGMLYFANRKRQHTGLAKGTVVLSPVFLIALYGALGMVLIHVEQMVLEEPTGADWSALAAMACVLALNFLAFHLVTAGGFRM